MPGLPQETTDCFHPQLTAHCRGPLGRIVVCLLPALLVSLGCGTTPRQALELQHANNGNFYRELAKQVDYADPQLHAMQTDQAVEPFTIDRNAPTEYWNLPLEEAIVLSLTNSPVLRDLGGQLLRSPATVPSIHNPGIVETDPRFGIENALSAFDTSFNTRMFYEKNDRALNNAFFGGGTRVLQQDLLTAQSSLTKTAATGTQFIVRHNTNYDANNAPGNLFPSAWDTNVEAEFRHPLLQGSGTEFNRIAGPGGQLGLFNGVVLARMNTDISLAEFETAVRNMIADVENGYWDLYYAYRDLQTKIVARDNALLTWQRINALYATDKRGGEADKEAQAREQYYRFQEEVENALTGQVLEGTHTNNGSSGGTFRGTVGVQLAERRLRLVCGLPISDGRMIRPSDEPLVTKVVLDWSQTSTEALARRPELRRQRWQIKRREMELLATRNYLMPRLDATGRYRFRGFGDELLNSDGNTNGFRFDNAYDNLLTGDFQEWQLGVDLTVPIGFRRAHTAVRNAQLLLARERAVLNEQERSVLHDLSNAVADLQRAFAVTQTSYNRLVAARDQLNAVKTTYDADKAPLDLLLEAQRRNAEAEGRYYRSLVEYATALRNVHFEKGTSLEYHSVFLNDDRQDFSSRRFQRNIEKPLNYAFDAPIVHPAESTAQAPAPQAPVQQAAAPQGPAPQLTEQPAPQANPSARNRPTLAPPQVVPTTSPAGAPTGSPIPTHLPADAGDRPVPTAYNAPSINAPSGSAPPFNPQASAPAFAPAPSAPAGSMIYPAAIHPALPQVIAPGSPNTSVGVVTPARTFAPAPRFEPAAGSEVVRPASLGAPQNVAPAGAPQPARPTVIRLPLPTFEPDAPVPGQPYPTAAASRNNDPWAADADTSSAASQSSSARQPERPALPKILFGPAHSQP
jgi:hypothetical protein